MNDKKGVLRSTTVMFLFVGLFGIWMGGCQTQEQKEIKRLIKQLGHKNSDVRMTAAGALGSIGTKDAVPALIQALQDQDKWVRVSVSGALGKIGTPEAIKTAVSVLVQLLQNQDVSVRANAVYTLGSIEEGAIDAVPDLIQALQDPHEEVRGNVVQALEKIGTLEALEAVEEYQSR